MSPVRESMVDRLVFDRLVFDRLASDLGDVAAARRIALLYLDLLEGRVARLATACEADDLETALDAVLSLKVSSAMVGAAAMRDRAAAVEACLTRGDCGGALRRLGRVRSACATTADALNAAAGAGPTSVPAVGAAQGSA
jgi:HPt (histidine-containing phosphotransfer) domain-containing protein